MKLQVHLLGLRSFFAKKSNIKCINASLFFQLLLSLSQVLRSGDDEASTSSGSYESDSGDSDESSGEGERGFVDITLQRLQSVHAVASNYQVGDSTYSRHGRSKKRIAHALKYPLCRCLCQVPLRLVLGVCMGFWLLSKQGQDSVLWSLQHENEGKGKKKDWYIEGLIWNKI